ncbi:SDR family NAD(P)-dependent oxidoreductase [Celeribacter litoreus]|uniref:SDR family NAD(P)-dependent oxidoreductase n=1 Tax=Celeribacter litoreus TaxID=2876714 RepID=UPI001CCE2DE6|nr:SDR family NAD(P)-dependent oxidoreductase [Celeribacter litoreus]MCA0042594.1 SDR family NAD(P)-dependent oxidoreductase [Celeribacter litoreus]
MQRALVIGSSGGIGAAVADELTARNFEVTPLSRAEHGFDLRDPAMVEQALGKVEGPFDTVVVATGQLAGAGRPPEKMLKAITAEALSEQFAVNAIGPALILRHLPRLLPKDAPSKALIITARVGSIGDNGLGGWYSYRAAKAAANQLVHTAAIELARSHKQACLLAYHPGTVATRFTENYPREKLSPEAAAEHLLNVMEAHGPEDTGRFYDWKNTEVPW